MNALSSPPTGLDATPELARRFALIVAGLVALIARRFLRMPHLMRFTVLLCGRLNRAVRRFARALARKPRQVRAARVRVVHAAVARAPVVSLPRGRGWLVRALGWEAAAYMSQLEALLAEAGARSAVAGSPAAARILRPVCRMLGVAEVVAPVARVEPAFGLCVEPAGMAGIVGDCEVLATIA